MSQLVDIHSPEFRQFLRETLQEMLEQFVRANEQRSRELALMERVVRVEEELKALREIESARFEAMERRFEALQREMHARFEAMERRFEAIDQRFEALQREMHARFEALQREMDTRFQAVEKRLNFLQWMMGIGFTLTNLVLVLLSLWR